MKLIQKAYLTQYTQWPKTGRQILAQFDEQSIIVYQAYRPSIAHYATRYGHFGGEFSFARMSWIKPSFLWMMYRSGWASKPGQEVILAVRLKRDGFDTLLAQAIHSLYQEAIYHSESLWKLALNQSNVRLQWDPDHDPIGAQLERRALQLGLRGEMLVKYAREWIIEIEDISDFVHKQHQYVHAYAYHQLMVPYERIYPVSDADVAARLGLTIP